MSRIYGGIHTMSANLEGQKAGIKLADWVFDHSLMPATFGTLKPCTPPVSRASRS